MLKGKTALVTGSTSGIGLGIAQALAQQGANIVLNGFGDVEAPKAAIAAHGVKVGYHGADMSKPAEIDDMMRYAGEAVRPGRHPGQQRRHPACGPDRELPDRALGRDHRDQPVAAPSTPPGWHCRPCRPRKWGRIINVASVHGLVASAEKSAYVAAKHGIVGLTKVTALENAVGGVTCNAICPGWVLTPLVQKQVDAKAASQGVSNDEAIRLLLGEKEPSMQFTTPEELGALAVFFCSPAGNNVRGVAWNMDGGWAAQ